MNDLIPGGLGGNRGHTFEPWFVHAEALGLDVYLLLGHFTHQHPVEAVRGFLFSGNGRRLGHLMLLVRVAGEESRVIRLLWLLDCYWLR